MLQMAESSALNQALLQAKLAASSNSFAVSSSVSAALKETRKTSPAPPRYIGNAPSDHIDHDCDIHCV